MADCELCGAMKVSVRRVTMGRAEVAACTRCTEKMNLGPKEVAPGLAKARSSSSRAASPIGYASKGKRGKDIMLKTEKELVVDFGQRIVAARKSKGWNQATLGKRMAETVNIIKSTESGKRPTDSVLKKFERVLGITLFDFATPSETRQVGNKSSRGMTLGDYLDDLR
ncbi:MAG: hypothetical protein CMA63_02345 [Euryarchaeota archaeon]|nr:hypothetical protein [Euryarchaeota archaeon]|tara:strand:- start:10086 stop:10589 length:504 start_codon:yes stop_codon:yes gene_type:complete